jgi:hypothetical protein
LEGGGGGREGPKGFPIEKKMNIKKKKIKIPKEKNKK